LAHLLVRKVGLSVGVPKGFKHQQDEAFQASEKAA
jgi:hypothetical protein